MIRAIGIAIAVAITPITTIWRIGRLRTMVFVLLARGRHSARILSVLDDEGRQAGPPGRGGYIGRDGRSAARRASARIAPARKQPSTMIEAIVASQSGGEMQVREGMSETVLTI